MNANVEQGGLQERFVVGTERDLSEKLEKMMTQICASTKRVVCGVTSTSHS